MFSLTNLTVRNFNALLLKVIGDKTISILPCDLKFSKINLLDVKSAGLISLGLLTLFLLYPILKADSNLISTVFYEPNMF